MHSPKVSIVIPTYNRARFLPLAIRSVLDQLYSDFELLVIDDGSSDDTKDVVKRLPDSRIRYIQKEHRGISHSMNTGIRVSKGQLIARLDSDDIWLPHMLSCLIKVMDDYPKIGLVYARAQGMDISGNLLPDTRGQPLIYPDSSFRSIIHSDHTCNIAMVVRRECFEKCGMFDEVFRVNEDWDMYLRIAEHFDFKFHDQIVARYRYHDSNISGFKSQFIQERLDGRVAVLDKVFSRPNLPLEILALKPVAYQNVFSWAGHIWFAHAKFRKAVYSFGKAVCLSQHPVSSLLGIVRDVCCVQMHRAANYYKRLIPIAKVPSNQ